MDLLTLKLILTPALIGMVSLAGRRWGAFISGWLVGLPLTSGPICLFLALSHGEAFASAASVGIMAGAVSQSTVCLAYAWACRRFRWPVALLLSLAVFTIVTFFFNTYRLTVDWQFPLIILALLAIYWAMPPAAEVRMLPKPLPVWDIPARMIVATLFVLGLTGISDTLGPHLTGLLAPFPLYILILSVFAHYFEGPATVNRVLKGMLQGMFSFTIFFLIIAKLIERQGTGFTFLLAISAALGLQVIIAWARKKLH